MYILGLSCFHHDASAVIIKNGDIVAAAQEERFTRKRYDPAFPKNAVSYCLSEAGITISDVGYIAFYDNPCSGIMSSIKACLLLKSFDIRAFSRDMSASLFGRSRIKGIIRKELGYVGPIYFCEHHISHASSAFFPSPYKDAAILTIDDLKGYVTTSFGVGDANDLSVKPLMTFPDSLGFLYSVFTRYIGFKFNSGEYKVMGLAPYGKPKYKDIILSELIDVKSNGIFNIKPKYFSYRAGVIKVTDKFNKLLGSNPRAPETEITRCDMDLAASIQKVTEELVLKMVRYVYDQTGKDKLVMAGEVALNCVANGRILRESPFKEVWIQPASGDSGAALGAALYLWHKHLGNERRADSKNDFMKGSLLGPHYSNSQIEKFLMDSDTPYIMLTDDQVISRAADLLSEGSIIGWFENRMEFGPRGLGARSILGDARSDKMQGIINQNIKFRESFRPFASSVLAERASEYFDMTMTSPYMLLVSPVIGSRQREIPAVTHVDNSSRIQTVDNRWNPLYCGMIKKFYEKYGCPVIINTSFNVRGEPIVESPEDAYRCFMSTNIDYLVMGNAIIDKKLQKPFCKELKLKHRLECD